MSSYPRNWAWRTTTTGGKASALGMKNAAFTAVMIPLVVIGVGIAIVPVAITVALGLSSNPLLNFPIEGWTLGNYAEVVDFPGYLRSVVISLVLAVVVVVVSGTLGTLTAIGARNMRGRLGTALSTLVLAPIVFPSLAFGLALFQWASLMRFDATLVVLALGHVVLAVPFVARTVAAGLEHLSPEIEKAGRSLGARGWYLLRHVTLPLIMPSLLSASVFAFWISFDNFTLSFFLSSPDERTIPIQLLIMTATVVDPRLAAGATLLLLVSVPLLLAIRPLFSLRTIRDLW